MKAISEFDNKKYHKQKQCKPLTGLIIDFSKFHKLLTFRTSKQEGLF